jgi:hypothetical protein
MTAPGGWRRLVAGVREYLGMQGLLGAAPTDEARRAAASEAATEASQKRDAAEVLLSRGAPAEALRLGLESARRLKRAVELIDVTRSAALQRAVERAERGEAAIGTPPELDAAVTSAQTTALRRLVRAEIAVERELHVLLRDRRGLLRLRRQRWVAVAMVLLAPFALAAFLVHARHGIHVRASSVGDEEYAADRAIDGDPETEWVPAGMGEEWLELRFPAPRHVRTVRILNGDTLPDRASRKVVVEFYLHGERAGTAQHEFDTQYPAQWKEFSVSDLLCDRIRILVVSHFGTGAAIAEVEVN